MVQEVRDPRTHPRPAHSELGFKQKDMLCENYVWARLTSEENTHLHLLSSSLLLREGPFASIASTLFYWRLSSAKPPGSPYAQRVELSVVMASNPCTALRWGKG